MMNEYITFRVETPPINFKEEITFVGEKSKIKLICTSIVEGGRENKDFLKIKLVFLSGCKITSKLKSGKEIIEKILDILSFEYKYGFKKAKIIDKKINGYIEVRSHLKSFTTMSRPSVNKKQMSEIINRYNNGDIYYNLYRIAINQDNPIASFMLLYNILLYVTSNETGEGQKSVKKYIEDKFPEIEFTPSPHKKIKMSRLLLD